MIVNRDGCPLAVYEDGAGDPILWIQGTGVAASGWRPQLAEFARTHRCVSFDNRGIGASRPHGPGIDVERMADDAVAVLATAGIERAHVVGHSLGGLVALALARKAPERVRTLGLLCTFANGRVPTRLSAAIAWIGVRTAIGTRASRRRAFLELVRSRAELDGQDLDAMAATTAELFGRDLADNDPVVHRQIFGMFRHDEGPHLGAIRAPTLVVSGAEDLLAPPWAGRALADAIPGARYLELADTAHALPVTRAADTNRALRDLFDPA